MIMNGLKQPKEHDAHDERVRSALHLQDHFGFEPFAVRPGDHAARAVGRDQGVGVDFRVTVIEALVSEGLARHVAAEWTNTPDKLDAQADRLNLS